MAAKTQQPPQLQDQAASAALYVTRPKPGSSHPLLDDNGKLSSAGAATSLKYAKASDLPSFPSTGGVKLSSAGAAASLANSNQKSFEHWKPDALPAAEKAAYLAKDYQADPLWEPELSKAGSKAALLAARDGANVEIWMPEESSYGQSAAGQAAAMTDLSPVVRREVPLDAHHKALLAATGAMSGSRRRAESAPIKPKDVDTPWALKAAMASHRGSPPSPISSNAADPALDASRIHNIARNNVSREMYGSNPPVAIEVEEKNRQDTLRASAVAMARKMYAVQQDAIEAAKKDEGLSRSDSRRAAARSHNRRRSTASSVTSEESVPTYPQYTNLQEAAMRLAQERLAKLENEHKSYRDYYGQGGPSRSRLSIRNSLRRRSSSDGQLSRVDEEQSKKIRTQMSIFRSKVDEVDGQKRQNDRDALMAAAQRNVQARMAKMDEKVYSDTGKASPAMTQEWEKQARERAEAESAARMETYGKVGIGGGKHMDRSDIEAIARARLQPTFDDIAEKAEAQRARDEEAKLDEEERKRRAEQERVRDAELKDALKSAKEQEKQDERARKEEDKARKAEEKRLTKEKRKSKDNKHRSLGTMFGLGGAGAAAAEEDKIADEAPQVDVDVPTEPITVPEPAAAAAANAGSIASSSSDEDVAVHPAPGSTHDAAEHEDHSTPGSPNKKSWFSRFRRSSKATKPTEEAEIGGPAYEETAISNSTEETPAETSMRDVALAGRSTTGDSQDMYDAPDTRPSTGRSSSISSLSSSGDNQTGVETTPERGRGRGLKSKILGKLHLHSDGPTDEDDEFEEARDTFEEQKSPGPSGLQDSAYMAVTGESEHHSKFSEEL